MNIACTVPFSNYTLLMPVPARYYGLRCPSRIVRVNGSADTTFTLNKASVSSQPTRAHLTDMLVQVAIELEDWKGLRVLLKFQSSLINGRLDLSSEHITIISGMGK